MPKSILVCPKPSERTANQIFGSSRDVRRAPDLLPSHMQKKNFARRNALRSLRDGISMDHSFKAVLLVWLILKGEHGLRKQKNIHGSKTTWQDFTYVFPKLFFDNIRLDLKPKSRKPRNSRYHEFNQKRYYLDTKPSLHILHVNFHIHNTHIYRHHQPNRNRHTLLDSCMVPFLAPAPLDTVVTWKSGVSLSRWNYCGKRGEWQGCRRWICEFRRCCSG